MNIWVPAMFFDDHAERALPTPVVIRETNTRRLIDTDDPNYAELLDDANFYADPSGPDEAKHIVAAAKRLLKAVKHAHT